MRLRRVGDCAAPKEPRAQTPSASEPEGFLANLKNNPFSSRRSEDISVTLFNDRALVTLIVIGERADDGSVHRYRNIRLFSRSADRWVLELWYNYELTSL